MWEKIKSFGSTTKSSVTESQLEGEKVKKDVCSNRKVADGIVSKDLTGPPLVNQDPASVVSNLHEQCHCPVGECVQEPPSPIPGV